MLKGCLAETKWSPVCRWYFLSYFHRWNVYFGSNFTEISSRGSNRQQVSIGSDNGLVPNRRRDIIWTNDGLVWWCIYSPLVLSELRWINEMLILTANSEDTVGHTETESCHDANFVVTVVTGDKVGITATLGFNQTAGYFSYFVCVLCCVPDVNIL